MSELNKRTEGERTNQSDYTLPPFPVDAIGDACAQDFAVIDEYGQQCAESARAPLLVQIETLSAKLESSREINHVLVQRREQTDDQIESLLAEIAELELRDAQMRDAFKIMETELARVTDDAKRNAKFVRAFRNRLVGAIADMCVGEYEARIAAAESRVNQFENAFADALEKQKVKESGDA